MLSKLKTIFLCIILTHSFSEAMATSDWQVDISFSDAHSISKNVSDVQCESLFQPFRLTKKAIANIEQQPIVVSSSNEIISLYRPVSSENQTGTKKLGFWRGISNISLDGGKTFIKASFSTKKDPITKNFIIFLSGYCQADYVAYKAS